MVKALALGAVIALAGCSKDKAGDAGKTGKPDEVEKLGKTTGEPTPEVAPPRPKIDGPSISPTITNAIAFVVPKDAAWWGELAFPCYRGVMSLTGGNGEDKAGEAFEKLSPAAPAALAAAGIKLGRDLAAVGAFDCGGSPCMYVALALAQPDKLGGVIAKLLPGMPLKDHGKGHYTVETPGVRGPRTVHVRAVPIQWPDALPSDKLSREAARATHVVFIGGIDGKNQDLDPLAHLADAATAAARVKDAEGVLANNESRCVLGQVGAREFQPGFKLERARFALAAPSGKSDALMALLGSQRTLEFSVELVLSPAPTEAQVAMWIAAGRAYLSSTAGSVRTQFAGEPIVDAMFDMGALIGSRGFAHELKGKSLGFSWRTARVPASELRSLEARFERLLGSP